MDAGVGVAELAGTKTCALVSGSSSRRMERLLMILDSGQLLSFASGNSGKSSSSLSKNQQAVTNKSSRSTAREIRP